MVKNIFINVVMVQSAYFREHLERGLGVYVWNYIPNDFGYRFASHTAIGGLTGGLTDEALGGNFGQGATIGAIGWAAGEAANMAIGHILGYVATGFEAPKFQNSAFVYDASFGCWITFSNVITGPYQYLDTAYQLNGEIFTYRAHEMGHTSQGTLLEPGYMPAHASSLTVGSLIGAFTGYGFMVGSHRFGLLERYWHPVPSY